MADELERGDIFFFYRPKMEAESAAEVQRLYIVLSNASVYRLLIVGSNRLPEAVDHSESAGRRWAKSSAFAVKLRLSSLSRAVDLIYGHSSHQVRPLEVYKGKLILHGCGDFINDYEGIGGDEAYRDDLTLMYLPSLEPSTGDLVDLEMILLRIPQFQSPRRFGWRGAHPDEYPQSREPCLWYRGRLEGRCALLETSRTRQAADQTALGETRAGSASGTQPHLTCP